MNHSSETVIQKIRQIIVLDARLLGECIEGVINGMRLEDASALRKLMRENPLMDAKVRRLTCDLSVTMTLAKTMESDEIFSSSLIGILDTDLAFGNGLLSKYGDAFMQQDIASTEEESLLTDCLPRELVRTRASRVVEAISRRIH